ncbi:MAG: zinc ribbon domain-containing protein [candidate division Zixibacteria bacterium]|nr:zinc ribbon domain-containing protein [candidate division Zixibacteria bacterium]
MPIYEYHCATCDDNFELLVKSAKEGEQVACPDCEGTEVTKKFSTFAADVSGGSDTSFTPAATRGCGTGCGCHI